MRLWEPLVEATSYGDTGEMTADRAGPVVAGEAGGVWALPVLGRPDPALKPVQPQICPRWG